MPQINTDNAQSFMLQVLNNDAGVTFKPKAPPESGTGGFASIYFSDAAVHCERKRGEEFVEFIVGREGTQDKDSTIESRGLGTVTTHYDAAQNCFEVTSSIRSLTQDVESYAKFVFDDATQSLTVKAERTVTEYKGTEHRDVRSETTNRWTGTYE